MDDRTHGNEMHEVEVEEETTLAEVDEGEEVNTNRTKMERVIREMTISRKLLQMQ